MVISKVDSLPYEVLDDILTKLPAKSLVRFMCLSKSLCTNSITLTTLQILIRLPAKSLVRFMCLSKSWHNLIRNDCSFKALYSKTSNARQVNPRYLVQQMDHRKEVRDMFRSNVEEPGLSEDLWKRPFLPFFSLHQGEDLVEYKSFGIESIRRPNIPYHRRKDFGKDYVIGSLNGLFLMGDHHGHFLWNPSINKVKAIPEYDFPSHWSRQTSGCGVGFCTKDEQDFKIVSFGILLAGNYNDTPQMHESVVSIFSMSTDSWKEIQGVYIPGYYAHNSKVSLDGVPHWAASSWERKRIIMSFNFDKEEFGHIMSPVSDVEVLGICKGLLSILRRTKLLYYDDSKMDCEMWILRGYGGEHIWTKLFLFQRTVYGNLLSLGHNGEIFMSEVEDGKLCALYDTGEVREFDMDVRRGRIIPHRESLLLLGD
ncbi:hypothetical protein Tsubulata_034442 [Turnera subulata]|uniref:F-box domain-containing protein n=1 Tax=Turnera subulata TaxID=218843 RepID=A0A9Q0F9N8_9ROSI|nr:hypothetical protein Tsubulata_034442 [Turnera subulata]